LILALIFFVGCKKDVGKLNHGDFPYEIGKIISSNCSVEGCHNSQSFKAASGLNLVSWSSLFAGTTNGSAVIPFSSRFSPLCYFVNTYDNLGLVNAPTMPLNKAPLPPADVKQIIQWVNSGAPDINGKIMWAGNPGRKKVYVVNQGCDVVTVMDSETQLPIRFIDVGNKPGPDTPHYLRVSPDGNYWYVVFINNNIMQKFRCSDDSYVGDIPLTPVAAGSSTDPAADANNWNTFVITADSRKAYCVSWTDGKVSAVDLQSMKLLHYLPGFTVPHGIALDDKEENIYVTAQTGNYLSVLDTGFTGSPERVSLEAGKPATNFPGLDIHDIILSPDKKSLLVTCQSSNEVRVFDLEMQSVTHVIPTADLPQEIVYSERAKAYYVTCTNDTTLFPKSHGVVAKIDAASYHIEQIPCGFEPHGIAADDRMGLLYVASRNIAASGPLPHHTSVCSGRNGFVNFIDLRTFKVLDKRYELSADPYFIFTRP
jgi:DNA-binding beta-propeller fold protein YncE